MEGNWRWCSLYVELGHFISALILHFFLYILVLLGIGTAITIPKAIIVQVMETRDVTSVQDLDLILANATNVDTVIELRINHQREMFRLLVLLVDLQKELKMIRLRRCYQVVHKIYYYVFSIDATFAEDL